MLHLLITFIPHFILHSLYRVPCEPEDTLDGVVLLGHQRERSQRVYVTLEKTMECLLLYTQTTTLFSRLSSLVFLSRLSLSSLVSRLSLSLSLSSLSRLSRLSLSLSRLSSLVSRLSLLLLFIYLFFSKRSVRRSVNTSVLCRVVIYSE